MTLDASYRQCRTIARRHGTTFFLATGLLPADRRRHVHALYAFARTADDLVDEPGDDPAGDLDRLMARFREAIDGRDHPGGPAGGTAADRGVDPDVDLDVDRVGGPGVGPAGGPGVDRVGGPGVVPAGGPGVDRVLAAVADTVRRFEIPPVLFERFAASMRQDLVVTSYERWDDLVDYMEGSAAAIGEMLLPLLDPVDRAAATGPARALGLAFQLTNFLRDVDDDLRRGRQYLPQDDLRRFGVDLTERRCDGAFVELMRFEIDRCRELYALADQGLPMLPRRSRIAIGAARSMYAAILDEIEASGYEVVGRRARVPTAKRLWLLAVAATRLWR